jgi:hypothetical protein
VRDCWPPTRRFIRLRNRTFHRICVRTSARFSNNSRSASQSTITRAGSSAGPSKKPFVISRTRRVPKSRRGFTASTTRWTQTSAANLRLLTPRPNPTGERGSRGNEHYTRPRLGGNVRAR